MFKVTFLGCSFYDTLTTGEVTLNNLGIQIIHCKHINMLISPRFTDSLLDTVKTHLLLVLYSDWLKKNGHVGLTNISLVHEICATVNYM